MIKRRLAWGIAFPVALSIATVVTMTPEAASAANTGTLLQNATSYLCIIDNGGSTNSAAITQADCDYSPKEYFYPVFDGNGYSEEIKSSATGKCLTNGGSPTNSAPITQYTCNGSPNQEWEAYTLKYGVEFHSINATGDCITGGEGAKSGSPVTQYPCNGSTNQQFNALT
jgi:hypothetical protein